MVVEGTTDDTTATGVDWRAGVTHADVGAMYSRYAISRFSDATSTWIPIMRVRIRSDIHGYVVRRIARRRDFFYIGIGRCGMLPRWRSD